MNTAAYSAVAQEEEAREWKECGSTPDGSEDGYLERPTQTVNAFLIAISLIIGLALGVGFETHYASSSHSFGSYETGFTTEKLLPPELINLEIKTFSGQPIFLPNGSEVIQLDPRVPIYVGDPSPEIDDAWEYLIQARYFSISPAEAQTLWGSQYMDYVRHNHSGIEGTFRGGLDVFHSLHCLNELRKRLSPEYYTPSKQRGKVHDMHCINHLRQVLQCSSAASIIPKRYRPTAGIEYTDAEQPHVCRDFGAIHNYTRKRNAADGKRLLEWRDIVY